MVRPITAAVCLSALLLAGCIGAGDSVVPAAATDATVIDEPPVLVPLYAFDALVAGAGPPHPNEWHGGLVEPLPVAREDAFVLPEGALELKIDGGPTEGTGVARVEVVAPDGRVVWASVDAIAVGVPGVLTVGLYGQKEYKDMEALAPGEYRVLYRVGGVFHFTMSVDALMPPAK